MRDDWGVMTGQLHDAAPAPTAAPHRSDAGDVRLRQRDINGLILCAEHFGAPYDLLAGSRPGGGAQGTPPPDASDPAPPGPGSPQQAKVATIWGRSTEVRMPVGAAQ